MISAEQNLELTDTSAASRMGQLLRRYWYPLATVHELSQCGVKPVRLLGENLVLFSAGPNQYGLAESRCPHRGASLDFAISEDVTIRCPYHGWKFDRNGRCLETPNEPSCSSLASKVKLRTFQARALGGLIFGFIGEDTAAQLPAIDLLLRNGIVKRVRYADIPCNWLQVMENALDPTHLEWLHGHFVNYLENRAGRDDIFHVNRHEQIAFERTSYGIVKRRTIAGQSIGDDDWVIGQHLIFPNIFRVGKNKVYSLHFRVPVDNGRTIYIWYDCDVDQRGDSDRLEMEQIKYRTDSGELLLDSIEAQDIAIFLSQGVVADRTRERLGTADQGIILYRKLLSENMLRCEQGKLPLNCDWSQPLEFQESQSNFKILERLHA